MIEIKNSTVNDLKPNTKQKFVEEDFKATVLIFCVLSRH